MKDRADRPVTLRQLLRLGELAGHEAPAETSRLDREVRDVVVVTRVGADTVIPQHALVVTEHRRTAGYQTELLLRRADTSGAVGVLLTDADRLMLSTRRLADRLGMPLVALPAGDPVHLAWRLSRHVHDPRLFATTTLTDAVRQLRTPIRKLSEVVTVVDGVLGATTAVLSTDGAVVAGEQLGGLPADLLGTPVPQQVSVEGGHLLTAPVFVEDLMRPGMWLVTRIPCSHPSWTEAAAHVLSAAALAVAGWAARQQLVGERDARDRSALLAELLDAAPAMPRHLAERALRAGWRLDGWHAGVHVRAPGGGPPLVELTTRLRRTLRDNGVDGPVVERIDGWASWLTESREPSSVFHKDITARVRRALDDLADLDLVAGIGRPYSGPGGIATTLREAREASLFAGSGGAGKRVEHVDELGVRRVLADWYHAEAFRSYARTLLAPLLSSGEERLLETLRTYLESESSASSAAAVLGVHRNTVTYRVGRIEELLDVNLSRPDERLVLQLACRVLRGETDA